MKRDVTIMTSSGHVLDVNVSIQRRHSYDTAVAETGLSTLEPYSYRSKSVIISARRYCDRSCLFVGWLMCVRWCVRLCLFVSSHPVTGCNGRCATGGSAAGERRCRRVAMRVRLAEVALYERVF